MLEGMWRELEGPEGDTRRRMLEGMLEVSMRCEEGMLDGCWRGC